LRQVIADLPIIPWRCRGEGGAAVGAACSRPPCRASACPASYRESKR